MGRGRIIVERESDGPPTMVAKFCANSRVHVDVRPTSVASATDESGYVAHCLFQLPSQGRSCAPHEGWRRVAADDDAHLEVDSGTYWFPHATELYVVGGSGPWAVEVWDQIASDGPRQDQRVWLTRRYTDSAVIVPRGHSFFRALSGTLLLFGTSAQLGVIFPAELARVAQAVGFVQTGRWLRGIA